MPALSMTGVRKEFPGVVALDAVDFTVRPGEVRALMGENGAGKSTLIKVLTGVHAMDQGEILLNGQRVTPMSPAHAQELGISTVYQEIDLVPNLTVAENVCLGCETGGLVNWRAMKERARKAIDPLGIKVDVTRALGEYPIAIQQLVSIARAIDRNATILILDEPTSSLDREEVARLFDLMRGLKEKGLAIVFVTHFLDQVFSIADSVTVLRNGHKVGDWPVASINRSELVAQMLGRNLEEVPHVVHESRQAAEQLLSVQSLGRRGYLQPISFEVNKGECLGLSGLLGSGRTETMKLLFGAVASDSGEVTRGTKSRRIRTTKAAIDSGIGFCPEDRKAEALFPGLSVTENLCLLVQAKRGWLRPLGKKSSDALMASYKEQLQIKAPTSSAPIETLSGGNQQKVILSRWLASEPDLLMLDEPTRGIDIGSKFEIRKTIRDLVARGSSFLFTSSELEEVVNTCDRVVVLRDRNKVGELSGEEVTESNIMAAIAKGDEV